MNIASTSALLHEANQIMDSIAEHKLQSTLGISYSRFVFLYVINQHSQATQHTIAQTLRISDPAVSKLCEIAARDAVISIAANPLHKRQRLVSLTENGKALLQQGMQLLDACFSDTCTRADINEAEYRDQTARLLQSLQSEYITIKGM